MAISESNHHKLLILMLLSVVMTGCGTMKGTFSEEQHPAKPDYSQASHWAALPQKQDYADLTPADVFQDAQSSAAVDVFFIYPTIYEGRKSWNADVNDPKMNHEIEVSTILNQATVFNGDCRVYSPFYRQMSLKGYHKSGQKDSLSKKQALDLAYQDVKAAFEYYLKNYNNGRPFIIAGHSQGTQHGVRLVLEMIDGKPLQKQMIAAYLPGIAYRADAFKQIPVGSSPAQTGCILNWNCILENKESNYADWYKQTFVVNPVNWKSDGTPAPASEHKGMVWKNFTWDKDRTLRTSTHNGTLWVQNPIKLPLKKNFHIGDYNLFWVNIRENVGVRVQAYLQQNK